MIDHDVSWLIIFSTYSKLVNCLIKYDSLLTNVDQPWSSLINHNCRDVFSVHYNTDLYLKWLWKRSTSYRVLFQSRQTHNTHILPVILHRSAQSRLWQTMINLCIAECSVPKSITHWLETRPPGGSSFILSVAWNLNEMSNCAIPLVIHKIQMLERDCMTKALVYNIIASVICV